MFGKLLRRREFPHFCHYPPPPLLLEALEELQGRRVSIVDLGCGDGAKLFAIQERGMLGCANRVVGVDLDASRLAKLQKQVEGARGIVADATHVQELEDQCADLVICSMLLEHVPDDLALAREIRRLLRQDGIAFISTVIKRWYGMWIYRRSGRFTLAPEHVREYPTPKAPLGILQEAGLAVVKHRLSSVGGVSPAEALVFLLVNVGLMKGEAASTLFVRRPWLRRLARLRLLFPRPIGFQCIHVLARRA